MASKTNTVKNGQEYYRLSLFLGYDSNGKRKYKEFYGRNKSEAEALKLKFLKNNKRDNSKLTLGSTYYKWLTEVIKVTGVKDSTYTRYLDTYNSAIKDGDLAWVKLGSLSSEHIQRYYNKLAESGRSYAYIQRVNKELKRFFNYCIAQDYILKNYCIGVVIPDQVKQDREIREIEIFTEDEIKKIINKALELHPIYGYIIELLVKTGARQGEILGLTKDCVHADHFTICSTLKRTRDKITEENYIGLHSTKNRSSNRIIYFSTETKEVFKRAKFEQNKQRLANPNYNNELDLVFTTASGRPIEAATLRQFWVRLLKTCGIDYRKMHTLRHTFISNQACAGTKKEIVQAIVGHKKGSIVTDYIYTHLEADYLKNEMKKVIK